MSKSIAYEKALAFSVEVIKFCQHLKENNREYDIARQLQKSGTSIGANLAEANGAISSADFSSKVSIAYKETLETKYWLDLLLKVELISQDKHIALYQLADELAKILFSILKSTRINKT